MTDTTAPTPQQPILGRFTGLVKSQGFKGAAQAGWGDVKNIVGKDVTMGQRGVGFARVGGVAVGASMAGHALFSGKTADGEDRSLLARVGEFILGAGVAVGSLVVGKGR